MRDATTVLGIIRERGRRGLPLEDVYRQLFNPALYLQAYGKISRNAGAMTPGVTADTVDGMSLTKIQAIIEQLRSERYRWTPVRRTYIEKHGSTKRRPLGIPTWSDKLLQEVIRLILEAYYEPQFSSRSHGFRPNRGCHTALSEINRTWKGTTWFIEGDISQCFDSLDHQVLLAILRERIHDNRFLRLIEHLLKAGYLEEWRYGKTLSGTPQGGIASPILANIYLDRLDQFVEQTRLPAYNRGAKRAFNPEYTRIQSLVRRRQAAGNRPESKRLRQRLQRLPSLASHDPAYRRLRYLRYADDFLLGFTGPRHEAEDLKQAISVFLRETLNLQLSDSKTLITHARTEAAHFLGYEIVVLHEDDRRSRVDGRRFNGRVGLRVPKAVVWTKCQRYSRFGKPMHRLELVDETVFSIIRKFQQEFRGLAEYYQLAYNRSVYVHRLKWVMETALTKTLARKLNVSVSKVYDRFGTTLQTPEGPSKVLQVSVPRPGKRPLTATWGGISLRRRPDAVLHDEIAPVGVGSTELVKRLLADTCEQCGSQEQVQVHHIRHLKDLKRDGRADRPAWVTTMASRQRKTLVVCHACHWDIHYPQRHDHRTGSTGEPGARKRARPVRRGADGKVPA